VTYAYEDNAYIDGHCQKKCPQHTGKGVHLKDICCKYKGKKSSCIEQDKVKGIKKIKDRHRHGFILVVSPA
jgi:hypothetical protein